MQNKEVIDNKLERLTRKIDQGIYEIKVNNRQQALTFLQEAKEMVGDVQTLVNRF